MRPALRLLLVLGLSLAALGLWLAEVALIKGWTGSRWLGDFLWSSAALAVLVPAAALAVTENRAQKSTAFLIVWVAALALVLLPCIQIARLSLRVIHTPGVMLFLAVGRELREILEPAAALALPLIVVLASLAIYVAVHRFLQPLRRWTIAYLIAGFLLVMPLSLLTIRIFPALDGKTDSVSAVKMGYAAFWCVLLVAAAVWAGARSPARGQSRH
jgi:hypothetical protein